MADFLASFMVTGVKSCGVEHKFPYNPRAKSIRYYLMQPVYGGNTSLNLVRLCSVTKFRLLNIKALASGISDC